MPRPDALDRLIGAVKRGSERHGPDLRKVLDVMMSRARRGVGRVRRLPTRTHGRRRPLAKR